MLKEQKKLFVKNLNKTIFIIHIVSNNVKLTMFNIRSKYSPGIYPFILSPLLGGGHQIRLLLNLISSQLVF